MKAFFSVLVLLLSCSLLAASDKLLRPHEAFKLSTKVIDQQTIKATWSIAEGYYLYQDKIDFISQSPHTSLSSLLKPDGKKKKDPTFGDVNIYRDSVSFNINLEHNGLNTPNSIEILSKSQGCADIGLCYPPQKTNLTLTLPASEKPQPPAPSPSQTDVLNLADDSGISSITGGLDGIDNQVNEPLPPEEAFKFDIIATDANTLNARWNVTPGHYLYQHKIAFSIVDTPSEVSLGEANLPKGKAFNDVYFGDVVTYEKDFEVTVPVTGYQKSLVIKTEYQGCSKLTGICYPQQTQTETVDFSNFIPTSAKAPTPETTVGNTMTPEAAVAPQTISAPKSEQSVLSDILKNKGIFTIIGVFFLAGLVLTFTPCVFPMIPILSSIITGEGKDISRGKSFALSLAYVVPMALTYAVAGIIAGYTGANIQAALQNPWVISVFAFLFVVLSFSMFGFYELQMPSIIQNRLNNISYSQKGGSLIGAGIMGVLSALIVGPCVTAPLIAILVYIADTKNVVLGGLSLFMLGMGMGAPLLLIGISAGSILPRAGAWMETVKHFFGVMMLGLAIWMLDRIVPPQVTLLLLGVLLIGSAIFLGATDRLTEESTGWRRLSKSGGLVSLLIGVILVIGAASGSKSYFSPLSGLLSPDFKTSSKQVEAKTGLQFQRISSLADLNSTLDKARSSQTAVMLDFYANWCLPCREMEHTVFSDPSVVNSLKDTIVIQADVTKANENNSALLKELKVFGPPHVIFYDRNGKEKKDYRIAGEMKLAPFKQHLSQFLSSI